jgi:peptidyl-dipeptidase Dcp
LHGLLSNVRFPALAGTSVPTDFVEFPSQLNEMWASNAEVLANYARHYQTGEPMPQTLMHKVIASRQFNQGYDTTAYLAAAILDQAYHQTPAARLPSAKRILSFETKALEAAHVASRVVHPRYRSTYFSHVFADPIGYSAGYYSYIWSEVLACDAERWFNSRGGLSRKSGALLREQVLSRGFTRDPLGMFEKLKGGPPDVEPLLEARGLKPREP